MSQRLTRRLRRGIFKRPYVAPVEDGVTLNELTLSAAEFTEGAPAGTVIGAIGGATAGSTVAVFPNDGRVAISGGNLVVGATVATDDFTITLRETLAGATNSPRSTTFTIGVVADTGSSVTFIDSIEIVGEVDYTVSAPFVRAIPMPTNGNVARVTFNNGADLAGVDALQLKLGIRERKWHPVTGEHDGYVIREVVGLGVMKGPYNDPNVIRPGGATVDISLSADIYNSGKIDSKGEAHNSQVVSVYVGAGLTPGSPAGFYTGEVIRTDSLQYPKPLVRHQSRVGRINDGVLTYEWSVVHLHAGNGSQLACFEAWAVSGGVDGVGGINGPIGRASVMEESQYTPAGGPTAQMGQLALRGPMYRTPIAITGLPSTASAVNPVDGVCWRAKPHWGPDWTSIELGDAWQADACVTPNVPKCLPMFINADGKYDRRYLWPNANRTAGATPTVQTGTADPGAANSYGFWRNLVIAGQAINAARGHEATSMTGIVVMLRDIPGSVRGANDNGAGAEGAYCVGGTSIWDSATTFQGFLEVRRAAGGGHSQVCRVRGVDKLGATIGGKTVAPKIHWRDIEFDSTGTGDTAALNVIAVCGANESARTPLLTKTIHSFERCWGADNSPAATWGTNTKNLQGMGHIYEFQCEWPTAYNGQNHSRLAGIVVSVGCFHNLKNTGATPRQNKAVPPVGITASWFFGGGMSEQDNSIPSLPPIRGTVLVHVRMDGERLQSGLWGATGSRGRYNDYGQGLCGVLFRRSATDPNLAGIWDGPLVFIGGDGTRSPAFGNYVHQYVTTACYGRQGAARRNGPYNETGAVRIDREIAEINCAYQAIAAKTGFFADPTTPQAANEGAHSSGSQYWQGDVVHDGNATASLRVYHACRKDAPAGMGITTANAEYWEPCGNATPTTAYGARSLRTGTSKYRRGVNSKNNHLGQFGATAGEQNIGLGGWKMDFLPLRPVGGTYGEYSADTRFVNDTSGGNGAFEDAGDYTANPLGPLVNGVAAGDACVPFDPYGRPRPNDGTGAVGFAEAA